MKANEEEDVYAAFGMGGGADADASSSAWTSTGNSNNPFAPSGSGSGAGVVPVPMPGSSSGNPLMLASPSQWTSARVGSAWGAPGSRGGNSYTAYSSGAVAAAARPMTSNRAVGFSATGALFDPTGQGRANVPMGPAPPLKKRSENSKVEMCMENERQVNRLVEESAMLAMQKDYGAALEKAKEAGKKERSLCKQCEQVGLVDQINVDLTYAVHFNLAVQYQNHQLYTEALNAYNVIVRNAQFPQAGRLRVNMGNIYAAQKKYLLAIKMYRFALDDPTTGKELSYKIHRNIGNAFVKMGQYRDAVKSYETVLEGSTDVDACFNLLLSYYALGETEKMKRTFGKMIACRPDGLEDGEEFDEEQQKKDVLVDDALLTELKERRAHFLRCLTTAARLIAPSLDKDWRAGYDYLIEHLRRYEMHDPSSHVASELEMCKYLNYLRYKRYHEAISGLKAFEKKDKALRARAATNLAYLYYLEGDYASGERYSDMSLEANPYNSKALVNKGNFHFARGDLEAAKEFYARAQSVEGDNVEAMYNLGLTAKRLGLYEEAMRVFKRVQSLVDSNEVLYQLADLHDLMGSSSTRDWLIRLIGRVPTDPNILARLGALYAREGDDNQAFHYYLEAYRYYQVNMDVISWLGAYFVKNEVYDKAIEFFERAAQILPQEVKWQLMVASCYRRRGDYAVARQRYEAIHHRHPDNVECLRYLVQLCKDTGLVEEANEWFKKMKKAERRQLSRSRGKASGSDSDGANDEDDDDDDEDNDENDDEDNDENDDDESDTDSAGGSGRKKRKMNRKKKDGGGHYPGGGGATAGRRAGGGAGAHLATDLTGGIFDNEDILGKAGQKGKRGGGGSTKKGKLYSSAAHADSDEDDLDLPGV